MPHPPTPGFMCPLPCVRRAVTSLLVLSAWETDLLWGFNGEYSPFSPQDRVGPGITCSLVQGGCPVISNQCSVYRKECQQREISSILHVKPWSSKGFVLAVHRYKRKARGSCRLLSSPSDPWGPGPQLALTIKKEWLILATCMALDTQQGTLRKNKIIGMFPSHPTGSRSLDWA